MTTPPAQCAHEGPPQHLLAGTGLLTTRNMTGGGHGRGELEAAAHQACTTRSTDDEMHSNINHIAAASMSLHRTWRGDRRHQKAALVPPAKAHVARWWAPRLLANR